jgi:hypothetical protein
MVALFIFGFLFLVFHGAAIGFFGITLYRFRSLSHGSKIVTVHLGYSSLIYGGICWAIFRYASSHWVI